MREKLLLSVIIILMPLMTASCSVANQLSEETTDYDTSSIVVVIKKEYSEFGKEYSPADFDEELIKSVTVINQIIPGKTDTSGYNLDAWQQMLSLELKDPSIENVEKAISAAYNNPEVEVAIRNKTTTVDLYSE